MSKNQQTVLDECKSAVAEYCGCDACQMDMHLSGAAFDGLDFVDMYEICLGVALRVKGKKAMSWDEFLMFRKCVQSLLDMAARATVCSSPNNGYSVA